MSDLRRWSEDGAMPEELRLIDAARSERLSDADRARMLKRAGIGAAVGAAAAASGTANAATGGFSLLAKIVVGVFICGAAAGGAWKLTRPLAPPAATRSAAAPSASTAIAATSAETAPTTSGDEAAPAEAPSSSSSPEPTAAAAGSSAARLRPTASGAASVSLSDEVTALERARKALASQSPEAALRELGKYDKRFPRGVLSSEQTVLRVQALLARGDVDKAIAVADQFAAANPDSPYARRVQELVRASRKK